MYQDILRKKNLQPCPDCGITICSCNNCHTMHCDSETLCNSMKLIQKMNVQRSVDPVGSVSVLDKNAMNISVYTSKINEKYDITLVSSLDEDQ